MKKSIFLTILSLFISLAVYATKPDSIYTRHGNTFVTVKTKSPSAIPTQYKWRDSEGKDYTIYLTATSCYIIKISKKGKEYKQYLPKEVRAEIAKELNMDSKSK